jgi:YbbR domain-containing protein
MSKWSSHPLFHNWHLKLFSLALAAVLWAGVASEPTSEIGVSVPVEYQNIPPGSEVVGDISDRVEVRLRGPSSLLRGLSPQDVSISIDMRDVPMGQEQILPLTNELIQTPFSIEVVRVVPARVTVTVEPTILRSVRVEPDITGDAESGFELGRVVVNPAEIAIEGPESHVNALKVVYTTPIDISDRRAGFTVTVDVDIPDPVVRAPDAAGIQADVQIRRIP